MTTPTYDRELIARMLADYMWPDKIAGRAYRMEAIQKQIDALNAALTARDAELRELVTDLHKVAPDMNTAVDMADWVRDALLALVGKGEG